MEIPVTIMLGIMFVVMYCGCGGYFNDPPVIEEIAVSKMEVEPGEEITINVVTNDPDSDELTYEYEVSGGEIRGTGGMVGWIAPEEEGTYFINVTVRDKYDWVQESITMAVGVVPALSETGLILEEGKTPRLISKDGRLMYKLSETDPASIHRAMNMLLLGVNGCLEAGDWNAGYDGPIEGYQDGQYVGPTGREFEWVHRDTDGTYTFACLFILHEFLSIDPENVTNAASGGVPPSVEVSEFDTFEDVEKSIANKPFADLKPYRAKNEDERYVLAVYTLKDNRVKPPYNIQTRVLIRERPGGEVTGFIDGALPQCKCGYCGVYKTGDEEAYDTLVHIRLTLISALLN